MSFSPTIVLVTGSFDTRLADVISEPQLSSQSEGHNEAFGQSEESEGFCLGMEAFKICNLRLDRLGRRPYGPYLGISLGLRLIP